MLPSLLTWFGSQQILVAGVGTVTASALLYTIRTIPSRILNSTLKFMTSTMDISSRNDFYNQIEAYTSKHIIPWTFRRYEPTDRIDDENCTYLNAGYGNGWGIWNGILYSFVKSKETLQGYSYVERKMEIRFFTRRKDVIEGFTNIAINHTHGEPRQKIYVSSGTFWERVADKRKRSLKTIFANDGILDGIVNCIDTFLQSEDWYLQRGIPYKLVILLYGPPGTGKTSIIHAVASHFDRDIDYITQLGSLGNLIGTRTNRKSIRVIEDIDTLAKLSREDSQPHGTNNSLSTPNIDIHIQKADQSPRILHDTLNTLDGFTTQHGLIMFVTSNHPENLDPALTRPGRMDQTFEIGPLNFEAATNMFSAFYGADQKDRLQVLKDSYTPTTGANLQTCFMENNAEAAIEKLKILLVKTGDDNA